MNGPVSPKFILLPPDAKKLKARELIIFANLAYNIELVKPVTQ